MELTAFTHFINGLYSAVSPFNLFMMTVALTVGVIGGIIPGISVVTCIALFVPFTFTMSPDTALICLGAVFVGSTYGGANAAILINTPGTPSSVATTFDGYPMTLKGRSEEALYGALWASVYGGIFGGFALLFFFEPLSRVALQFGSEAFFWLSAFGLSTLTAMFPGQMFKGMLGGALGLGISTVGLDVLTGTPRFTFGLPSLVQGLDMIIVMISLFSFCQMMVLLESNNQYIASFKKQAGAFWIPFRRMFAKTKIMMIASGIGTFIGILPGVGSSIASIVAYNEVKRWDKNPERFGTGELDGVLAPECSSNASVGGSLVPLMTLGIPGSAAVAVLVAGLLAQGLQPGPQLLEKNADIAYAFIASLIIVNFAMIPVGYVLVRASTKILLVPKLYIVPAIITLSFIGAYSLRTSMFDVLVMVIAGALSYALIKAKIQAAGIALGMVLGPLLEESLGVTIMRSKSMDSVADLLFFTPMSMALVAANILVLALPLLLALKKKNGAKKEKTVWKFRVSNMRRFDFWVLLVITAVGVLFLYETSSLTGESKVFPNLVFSALVLFGVCSCIQALCEPESVITSGKITLIGKTIPLDVMVYSAFALAAFFVIPFLGFYATMMLTMMVMLIYSSVTRGQALSAMRLLKFSLSTFGIVFAQYLCFYHLLNVATPNGILF